MIKINLLRSFAVDAAAQGGSYFSSEDEKKQILTDFLKRAAILLIGPVALYAYENQIIPELNEQLATQGQILSETRQFNDSKAGLADEIIKYEQEQARISAQMNFVEQVTKDKINELKLFQHLQRVTPETIWITKLQFKGSEVTLIADTDVPADIAKFMERLSSSDFLSNVSPVSQDVKYDAFAMGITLTTVTIKAEFVGLGSVK